MTSHGNFITYSPDELIEKQRVFGTCLSMTTGFLWTAFTWTYKGILCTCRFLWICPYNAIKFLPRERNITGEPSKRMKRHVGTASIPGSPDHTNALQKRLNKTERDILSLKTKIVCEKASWERRFTQLQRQQEELRNQLISDARALAQGGNCENASQSRVDNEDFHEEFSGVFSQRRSSKETRSESYSPSVSGSHVSASSEVSSRTASSVSPASSVRSWKKSCGPHRVFVPHSPMDLQLGHRVRIMLPSGRISTGTICFLGHLQGEADLHLGVELHTPDTTQGDGSHNGQRYFECKPGYGAFVPFHKLLMAWE